MNKIKYVNKSLQESNSENCTYIGSANSEISDNKRTDKQTKGKHTKNLKIIVLGSTTLIKDSNFFIFVYLPYIDTDPLQFYYKYRSSYK